MPTLLSNIKSIFTGGATSTHDTNSKDDDEAVDGTGAEGGSKKRPLRNSSEQYGQQKRQKRQKTAPSPHERRLIQSYDDNPPDAKPILSPFPSNPYQDQETTRPADAAMAAKYKRGGFRPTNTLAGSRLPLDARETRSNRLPYTNFGEGRPGSRSTGTPPFSSTKPGISSSRSQRATGDGFADHELQSCGPNKRRKLDMAPGSSNPSMTLDSDPIDLTADDPDSIVNTTVIARQGKPVSTSSHSPPFQTEPFDNSEYRRVEDLTRMDRPRPRRKSRDGVRSSQSSGRDTPAGPHANATNGSQRHSNGPMVELSDTDEAARSQQSAKATIGPKDAPPINLRQGFANIRASRNRRKETEEEELAEVGEFMQKNNKFKAKKSAGRDERQPQQRRHIQQPDEPEPEAFRSNVQAGQKSPRLQHTFVRDSLDETDPNQPKRPRTTAAQRLREQSEGRPKRVSPIDDGSSSPDVLNGEATIKSPQKEHHQTHHGNRSASPSDIRPTQFTKGTRVTRTKTAKKQSLKEEEAAFEATTIAIRAFFATSCIATSGLIELRYDSKHKQLELLIEGSTRENPSGGSVVAIGGRDVDKVMWHNGHTNRKVVLKGPAGNLSNGHVCLVFRRYEDVDWFLQRIDDITDHNHTREALDHEKLEKSFMFLGSAIQYRAQQLEIQRTREENLLLAAEKRGILKGNQHQQEDDERIRYEGEDDESNPKPKKTRAKTLREVLLSQEATGHERYGLNDNDRGVDTLHSSPYFQATEHSTRSRRPALRPRTPPPVKWTVENQPERWSRSVVYPQEGQRRVTVDFQDLERLDEGEFLNDNVISFALRQIEENISAEHKQSVHFFNTFFYTALTTKNGKKVFNYDAVKRWTKNIDLLSVPYIVVPININLHWFVAIICNLPSLGRKAAMLDDEDEQDKIDDHVTTDTAEPSAVPIVDPVAADVDPGRPIAAGREEALGSDDLAGDSGQHENEVSQSTDAMDHLSLAENLKSPRRTTRSSSQKSNSTGRKSKKKPPPPPRKYASDLPAIITLDSFGSQHSTETRYLKDYICAEAEDKRAIIVERNDIIGMTTKGIPEQTNFCDCGVYLVGYVEEFAKDPRSFVTKVLNKELDKEADFATFDPSAKRTQIRDMLLELQQQQEAEHKAKKAVKKGAAAPKPDGAALHAGLEDPKKDENSSATQKISTARDPDAMPESTALTSEQPSLQAQYGSDPTGNDDDEHLEMAVPRALPSRKSDTPKADDENHEMLDNYADGDKGERASSSDSLGSKDDLLDPLARSVRHGLTDSATPSSPVNKTERRRSPVVVVDLDVERTEIPDSQERLQTGGPSHIFFD